VIAGLESRVRLGALESSYNPEEVEPLHLALRRKSDLNTARVLTHAPSVSDIFGKKHFSLPPVPFSPRSNQLGVSPSRALIALDAPSNTPGPMSGLERVNCR